MTGCIFSAVKLEDPWRNVAYADSMTATDDQWKVGGLMPTGRRGGCLFVCGDAMMMLGLHKGTLAVCWGEK